MIRSFSILVCALLFPAFAGCGAGSGGVGIIFANNSLAPEVTILVADIPPGTQIHGEGVGVGGGAQCGNIAAFSSYRTADRMVWCIEDATGYCFGSDIYEVYLENANFQGSPGEMVFLNNGDPRQSGRTNGRAFFRPGGGTGFFVDEISVSQWFENGRLYISVRTSHFNFMDDPDDPDSVFRTSVRIERVLDPVNSPVVDFTQGVAVDYVDPHSAP